MSTEPPRRQTLGPKQRRSSVLAHPKTHAPLKASQTRSGEREKIRRARETRKHRPVVCSRTIRHSTHAPFRAAHALWGASGKGGPLLGGKRTILRMVPLSPPCGVGGRFFSDFLLGSVSVYCLSPVVEPLSTRKEVSALQSCGAPRILGVGISEKTFWVVLRRPASRTQMCRLLEPLLSWSSARMHRLPFSETRVCGRSVFFVL